jgi:hypothetical protein
MSFSIDHTDHENSANDLQREPSFRTNCRTLACLCQASRAHTLLDKQTSSTCSSSASSDHGKVNAKGQKLKHLATR